MSGEHDEKTEIDAAVAAIRAQRRGLVAISPNASPAMRDAIRAVAAELGREVLEGAEPTSHAARAHREWAARDLPEIERTDGRAFIKNLSKIARGDVRVK